MPKDAPVNIGAPPGEPTGAHQRVSGMQAKLHRWAAADGGRRSDDLFNLVCDPATLLVAFERSRVTPARTGSDRESKQSNRLKPLTWGFARPWQDSNLQPTD